MLGPITGDPFPVESRRTLPYSHPHMYIYVLYTCLMYGTNVSQIKSSASMLLPTYLRRLTYLGDLLAMYLLPAKEGQHSLSILGNMSRTIIKRRLKTLRAVTQTEEKP